jgi:protein-disulfide isomerase
MARATLVLVALAAVNAAAAGAQQAGVGASAGEDVQPLSRAGEARAIGPDSAMVILIEFIDFACTTCQLFHVQRGDSLRRAIGSDVRLVYLTLLHQNFLRSFHAAEAANCASVAGGREAYAAMADRLFRNSGEWNDAADPGPVFARYAREARADSAVFESCRARDLTAPLIVADMSMASTFGVDATPTFVAVPRGAQGPDDAVRVSGNVSIAQLTELISQARAKAK